MISWFIQRITGFLLIFYMAAHFLLLHYSATYRIEAGDAFNLIRHRLQEPFWQFLDISLLIVILYHALNGLKMVLNDFIGSKSARNIIVFILYCVGLFLLFVGVKIVLAFRG